MEGGDGNDVYITENVSDRIIEEGTGNDTIFAFNYLTFNMVLTPNVEKLYYNYIADSSILVTGNALNNHIQQGSWRRDDNGIIAGNDILDGGAGNDVLAAGQGDDTYRVDTNLDFVAEGVKLTDGIDTVESTALSFSLIDSTEGRVENLFFTGSGRLQRGR